MTDQGDWRSHRKAKELRVSRLSFGLLTYEAHLSYGCVRFVTLVIITFAECVLLVLIEFFMCFSFQFGMKSHFCYLWKFEQRQFFSYFSTFVSQAETFLTDFESIHESCA